MMIVWWCQVWTSLSSSETQRKNLLGFLFQHNEVRQIQHRVASVANRISKSERWPIMSLILLRARLTIYYLRSPSNYKFLFGFHSTDHQITFSIHTDSLLLFKFTLQKILHTLLFKRHDNTTSPVHPILTYLT